MRQCDLARRRASTEIPFLCCLSIGAPPSASTSCVASLSSKSSSDSTLSSPPTASVAATCNTHDFQKDKNHEEGGPWSERR